MKFEEKLIEQVRSHPILFDKTQKGYKNVFAKEKSWRSISNALGVSVLMCQRRWRTLRDQFKRELKMREQPSGSAAALRREWQFFECLTFLKDHVAGRTTSSNFHFDEFSDENMLEEYLSDSATDNSAPLLSSTFMSVLTDTEDASTVSGGITTSHNDTSSSSNNFRSASASSSNNRRTRVTNNDAESTSHLKTFFEKLLQKCSTETKSEVEHYFLSLAKVVSAQNLSSIQFLDLQTKLSPYILSLLEKYKS